MQQQHHNATATASMTALPTAIEPNATAKTEGTACQNQVAAAYGLQAASIGPLSSLKVYGTNVGYLRVQVMTSVWAACSEALPS
jgi:hypothetical protein